NDIGLVLEGPGASADTNPVIAPCGVAAARREQQSRTGFRLQARHHRKFDVVANRDTDLPECGLEHADALAARDAPMVAFPAGGNDLVLKANLAIGRKEIS